jgi:hypothetical protein
MDGVDLYVAHSAALVVQKWRKRVKTKHVRYPSHLVIVQSACRILIAKRRKREQEELHIQVLFGVCNFHRRGRQ